MPNPPAATRGRILKAALALFREAGFAATTVPSIAERAQIATGTMYRYFAGKEALANAVYQEEKAAMRDALLRALAGLGPAASAYDAFAACWEALLELLESRREGILFLEGQQHAAYLSEQSRAGAAEVDGIVLGVITRGQATGEIKNADAAVLVAMLYGAFVGLAKSAQPSSPGLVALTTPIAWDLISAKE
jgi:AcrR family transcriptional regulator